MNISENLKKINISIPDAPAPVGAYVAYKIVDKLNRFLKMIDRLQEIKDGKITKEEQDKKIGREYADEFVQPLVNKLDSKKS